MITIIGNKSLIKNVSIIVFSIRVFLLSYNELVRGDDVSI